MSGSEKFEHKLRPFKGRDIETWRNSHGLSMDDAVYALGLTNYKSKLMQDQLEFSLELLMRLYDEDPRPGVWPRQRIMLSDLFKEMYGKHLEVFIGSQHEVTARVDLRSRFSKLFGRSKGRAYHWLDDKEVNGSITNRTQEQIQAILSKLSQLNNPGKTLERLGGMIWALRGEDIDTLFPIPTLRHPPRRERRGRRPGSKIEADGLIRRVIAPNIDIRITDSSKLQQTAPLKQTKAAQSLVKGASNEAVKVTKSKRSVKNG